MFASGSPSHVDLSIEIAMFPILFTQPLLFLRVYLWNHL